VRGVSRSVLVGLLAVVATVGGARVAIGDITSGSVGIRLVDVPTTSSDSRARIYIVDHLTPNAVIHRRVAVSNGTAEPQRMQLYAAAANVTNGQFEFLDGHAANELTTWTTVSPSQVVVPPRGEVIATVTIQAPANVTPGERYGVIWAEPPPATGAGVTTVNRVGVRIYLDAGPGAVPTSDFAVGALRGGRDSHGKEFVYTTLANVGGRALDVSSELHLRRPHAGPRPYRGPATSVGPSEQRLLTVMVQPSVPSGVWNAQVSFRSGGIERVATGAVRFPGSQGGGFSSWIAIGAAGVAMVLAGAGLLWRHRHRLLHGTYG
jgi:hypothetical protein